MAAQLPEITGQGIIFMADPHLAANPPGQRLEGYTAQIMAKIEACLELAGARGYLPVILGDLFHWPRENPNSLLVDLIDLFGRYSARGEKAWVLVGNHDKHQARYTRDVSLAVLEAAGAVKVMSEPGPQFVLNTPAMRVVLGASPDMSPIPASYHKSGEEVVIWTAHHGVGFLDYEDKYLKPKELPGIDWLVNGHLHRPQPPVIKGGTRWINCGGMSRMRFVRANKERRPWARIWTPECEARNDLDYWEVPFLPFERVFPDQPLPVEEESEAERDSLFLQGLERLAWRRTSQGEGLKQFLQANLNPELPESRIIWELYEEIVNGE